MTKLLAKAFLATLLTATVSFGALCGDVNGDGVVNVDDALVVAQYHEGMRACGVGAFGGARMCDVNADGRCDMADAEMMVQCDVGAMGCNFDCRPFHCLRGQRKLGR